MLDDMNLPPGWLSKDVKRASERLKAWQDGAFSVDLEVSAKFFSRAYMARCPFPKGTALFEVWCNAHPDSFQAMNHRWQQRYREMLESPNVWLRSWYCKDN